MDLAWALMVGITQEPNSSNSSNVKFVKVLNSAGVACTQNILDTNGWVHKLTLSSSISCELNKSLVLEAIVVLIWKRTKLSWSSPLEDEVEWSLFEELEEDISQGLKRKKEG